MQTAPSILYTEIMLRPHRIWIVLILLSGWLGLPLAAPADPPDGYYDSVDSTDPVALRTTLHQVIDDHQRFPYTSGSTDTWDILNLADEDPNDSGNILDVYRNASYPKISGGVRSYNREHTWPKSYRHMGLAGISFDLGSSQCTAIHNMSYGAWQGIRVCNSTDVVVVGNTLFRNSNCGVYFLSAAVHGYAVGNILYENSAGVRWSSNSAHGMALHNLVFANHGTEIMIQNADDIRLSGNVLVNNAISQLTVKESRYESHGNCFETRDSEQLVAQIDFTGRYKTLLEYQQAVKQDLDSRERCGPLPKTSDVHRLHAESLVYAERARAQLAKDATKGSSQESSK